MTGRSGERDAVLISSGFVLGMVAGFLLKGVAKRAYKRARIGQWHREYEDTVTYPENLPEQLERREPAPQAGQPRYGGTGAIGVPPESAF